MTTHIGGRPRNPDTPTESGLCPEHGVVEFRIHKKGKRAGKQRYIKRCPRCHTIANGGTGEGIPLD